MRDTHTPRFVVRNSRTTPMFLAIEPSGWYWELKPGDVFEILFENWHDYSSGEPIDIKDEGITFWGAEAPIAVVHVLPNERVEMMI